MDIECRWNMHIWIILRFFFYRLLDDGWWGVGSNNPCKFWVRCLSSYVTRSCCESHGVSFMRTLERSMILANVWWLMRSQYYSEATCNQHRMQPSRSNAGDITVAPGCRCCLGRCIAVSNIWASLNTTSVQWVNPANAHFHDRSIHLVDT